MTDTIDWLDETTRRVLTGAVARPTPEDPTRRAFYVDDTYTDDRGIVPVLVAEDQPGYSPMVGVTENGTWYWGATLDEAWKVADLVNAELFGLTREQVMAIVGSSITAQADEDADPSVRLVLDSDTTPAEWVTAAERGWLDTDDEEALAHVLHHFQAGGWPASGFPTSLLELLDRADATNTNRLAQGFPAYVGLYRACRNVDGGTARLAAALEALA